MLSDIDGNRFSGWGVSLTPLGRSVLEALDRQYPGGAEMERGRTHSSQFLRTSPPTGFLE